MDYTKDEKRYLYTTSFPLASFLYSKGEQMSPPRDLERGKKEFVFFRNDKLNKLEEIYKFGLKKEKDLLINVRDYENARKFLLEILNN